MNLITDLKDERLVAGKYGDDDVRNASMTPPPWEPGVVGHEGEITTDKEKIKAHICESIDKATEDRPAYLVTAREGDEPVTICYTGNGPHSSAHAQAIAYLPYFIEALEIRDASLRAALAERDRLDERLSGACKLINSALGDGPECDCPPEGHICGWPLWKVMARDLLDAELHRRSGKESA